MRRLAFIAALALVSCAQPPAPVAIQNQPQDLAPRYPSWDEVPAPAAAVNPPIASTTGKPLIGGASLIDQTIRHNGRSIELQFVLFDSRSYSLQVIDQPEDWSGGGKITACMRSANAVAGVNGGFFTPQFTPMGLMIANGRKTGAWQQNKLLSGAVVIHQQPQLLWNAEVHGTNNATHLLQAGPRLVDGGRPVPHLERRKQTTRTFIANDGDHRWIIGLARDTSLGELAEVLASPSTFSDAFHIHRALNLDGGHSSALYYRTTDGHEHSSPGWSTVRNYLAIVPR
jgi:uncharacterized protein YigE (DUF2233 family)